VLPLMPSAVAYLRDAADVGKWLKNGGCLLAIGLDGADTAAFLAFQVEFKKGEHCAAYFEPPGTKSRLAGIGPADVHCRDPRELPLITGGATIFGDGVMAVSDNANVVFCQLNRSTHRRKCRKSGEYLLFWAFSRTDHFRLCVDLFSSLAIRRAKADESQTDLPAFLLFGHPSSGKHGHRRVHTASGSFSQSG
jgi:hypothetical protein